MSTGAEYVAQSVALLERVDGFELAPVAIRLLSEGEPVALERLAAAAGRPSEDVAAALGSACSPEWDEQGRLVGLTMTLRRTGHRFMLEGRTLYAWCAGDALMFPMILGRAGVIGSACPRTGRAIDIELAPTGVERIEPRGAVLTCVRPRGAVADVRSAVCAHGHFFASAEAASGWAATHPDGHVRPVEEAFRLQREIVARLGWTAGDAG
jgi:alkylmercury lyase